MSKTVLTAKEIRELLPHRYPMLMIDRVVEIGDKDVIAEKLITANEPFFQGHFPDHPIMPGVLILEALAQTAGVWAITHSPENRGLATALAGIDKARFRKPVQPGDVLRLHASVVNSRGRLLKVEGVARVDGEPVAEAVIMAAFVEWSALS